VRLDPSEREPFSSQWHHRLKRAVDQLKSDEGYSSRARVIELALTHYLQHLGRDI
jgi:metal-responsive CopG/Arc/MetJ family transcriptional regulator